MRMMKFYRNLVFLLGALFFSKSLYAVEYQSPRTMALGGSSRAAPLLNDSIYLNPSYASFLQIYSLSGGYTWLDQGRNYNVSVQDSRAEFLQAGVAYTERVENRAINIGASRIATQRLGFGLGSKAILDYQTNKMTSDLIFSTEFLAEPWFISSLIVDNILESNNGISRGLYRTIFIGTKFLPTKEVSFFVDPLYSPNYALGNKLGVAMGAEIAMLADFSLRLGKFIDGEAPHFQTRGSGFGVGVGWVGPRISFDYALSRLTSSHSGIGLSTAHALGTTIFL